MINRDHFFFHVRGSLFHGTLSQSQVDGLNAILDGWEAEKDFTDIRQLAYMLATAFHETSRTMQPIREFGLGRGRPYGYAEPPYGHIYYGRGLIQLTWIDNYRKFSSHVGVDLVQFPDKALEPAIAVKVLLIGMKLGIFTSLPLDRFIHAKACDFYDARRVVNGTDCATEIKGYASSFLEALTA